MNLKSPITAARAPIAVLLAAISLLVLSACGSDDEGDEPERPTGVTQSEASGVPLGTPREQLSKRLGGEEPLLTSEPTDASKGGCEYYAIEDKSLANAWQFCFDGKDEVKLSASLFSVRGDPEAQSPEQALMIGRGDVVCSSENAKLKKITRDLGKALNAASSNPSAANLDQAGDLLNAFAASIERTVDGISLFAPPPEEQEVLASYLDSLSSQAETLGEAREALLDRDFDAYDALGDEFTEIGEDAEQQAREYGFEVCSASTFG